MGQSRISYLVMLALALVCITVGALWYRARLSQACPLHPCDCHVEYSHCVKDCPTEGASKKYSTCCRLHCLAKLLAEQKK